MIAEQTQPLYGTLYRFDHKLWP